MPRPSQKRPQSKITQDRERPSAQLIRAVIDDLKISREQFARLIPTTTSTVVRWVAGISRPKPPRWERMKEICRIKHVPWPAWPVTVSDEVEEHLGKIDGLDR